MDPNGCFVSQNSYQRALTREIAEILGTPRLEEGGSLSTAAFEGFEVGS